LKTTLASLLLPPSKGFTQEKQNGAAANWSTSDNGVCNNRDLSHQDN
jgi:hypothetical protein